MLGRTGGPPPNGLEVDRSGALAYELADVLGLRLHGLEAERYTVDSDPYGMDRRHHELVEAALHLLHPRQVGGNRLDLLSGPELLALGEFRLNAYSVLVGTGSE